VNWQGEPKMQFDSEKNSDSFGTIDINDVKRIAMQ
jgi:hypothetical protein